MPLKKIFLSVIKRVFSLRLDEEKKYIVSNEESLLKEYQIVSNIEGKNTFFPPFKHLSALLFLEKKLGPN